MIIYLKKIKNQIEHSFFKWKALRQISNIQINNNSNLKLLFEVLNESLQNKISKEEEDWIKRIESLREKLNASKTEITIIDFGVEKLESNLDNTSEIKGRKVLDTVGNISTTGSKSYFWVVLLFKLIRKFKPKSCLELGTLVGISACYQAAALTINNGGKITTLEGSESLALVAKNNFEILNLQNVDVVIGRFQETLQKVAKELRTIDYAFIDGHHDENATISYFNLLLPYLADKAVLIFDDIYWTNGMKRAWGKIISNENVKVAIDLKQVGICILDKKDLEKRIFRIRLQ